MMTVEELGQALLSLGFVRGRITTAPESDSYIYRTPRVHLAIAAAALERCFEPPHQDEANAPWPVFLKLEARWLHAADIFRKNGLPVHRMAFEQYLSCLGKIGVFPSPVEHFYEFEEPQFLDLAIAVNTQTMADELTPEVVREKLQPMIDALVRAEIHLVFGATLDVFRHELHQKAELAKVRLPGES
jgi:hypothetical protein